MRACVPAEIRAWACRGSEAGQSGDRFPDTRGLAGLCRAPLGCTFSHSPPFKEALGGCYTQSSDAVNEVWWVRRKGAQDDFSQDGLQPSASVETKWALASGRPDLEPGLGRGRKMETCYFQARL